MSQIKGKNTKPELVVRSLLHRLGYRFRLHRKDLPGKPDIILPKYKVALFIHGCFWHRHENCKFCYIPKSNLDFWSKKFQETVVRDNKKKKQLEKSGWRVEVVWECEISDLKALSKKLNGFFPLHI